MKKSLKNVLLGICTIITGLLLLCSAGCTNTPTQKQIDEATDRAYSLATIEELLDNGYEFIVKKGDKTAIDNERDVRRIIGDSSFTESDALALADNGDYELSYENTSRVKAMVYLDKKIIVVIYNYKPLRGENQNINASGKRAYSCSDEDFNKLVDVMDKLLNS